MLTNFESMTGVDINDANHSDCCFNCLPEVNSCLLKWVLSATQVLKLCLQKYRHVWVVYNDQPEKPHQNNH